MGSHRTTTITFGDLLQQREFRAIWIAATQSTIGDQLGRVALAIMVYAKTGSPALTALTYAVTFLPSLLGGALLSGLADRLPRRSIMIGCDLARALLIGAMALPGVPTPAIFGLLILAVLANAPFSAAQAAMLPDVLEGERYVVGMGLLRVTLQVGQLAGFALGGILVSAVGVRWALAGDAATFLISAALLRARVERHSVDGAETAASSYLENLRAGARLVFSDRRLRTLMLLAWLAACYAVPEGLAAPYARSIGAGSTAVGVLMAADPAGTALGAFVFVRFVPAAKRSAWIGPLAVLTGLPLVLCLSRPGVGVSLALWALSGVFSAYQVQVQANFVLRVPEVRRGQAVGIASTGLIAGQGLGILIGGAIAGALGPAAAIALMAGIGMVLAIWLTSQLHARPRPGPGMRHRAELVMASQTNASVGQQGDERVTPRRVHRIVPAT